MKKLGDLMGKYSHIHCGLPILWWMVATLSYEMGYFIIPYNVFVLILHY